MVCDTVTAKKNQHEREKKKQQTTSTTTTTTTTGTNNNLDFLQFHNKIFHNTVHIFMRSNAKIESLEMGANDKYLNRILVDAPIGIWEKIMKN